MLPAQGRQRSPSPTEMVARSVAQARARKALRDSVRDPQKLEIAEAALENGDVSVACQIYGRLALRRNANPATVTARQRLQELREDGAQQRTAIDGKLAQLADPAANLLQADRHQQINAAFSEYAELARLYGNLPGFAKQLKVHVRQQSLKPQYAVVINEPEAEQLWRQGQHHEQLGSACCAFRVYQQAARLLPAPSAQSAAQRLAELREDPGILQAVEDCREVEWCQRTFNLAARNEKFKPVDARRLYTEVLHRAPPDSEVYRAARQKLAAAD